MKQVKHILQEGKAFEKDGEFWCLKKERKDENGKIKMVGLLVFYRFSFSLQFFFLFFGSY